jgi:hypothetical protein
MKTGDRTFEQTASSLILSIFAVLGLWSVPTTLVCANDAVGLGSILVEGTLRTGQDNIISRLAKGEACVDSARDFATALADNPELEGWRIQQATNVTLGHTAVVVTSNETGNSYYVDNYFGHTEIEPVIYAGQPGVQDAWVPNPVVHTSTGGFLFSSTPWFPSANGVDVIAGFQVNPHPQGKPSGCDSGGGTGKTEIKNDSSYDPNEMVGPPGYRDAAGDRYIRSAEPHSYTVFFENLETAGLAARDVVVEDVLPEGLDLDSFQFGPITIADRTFVPPPNSQFYQEFAQVTVDGQPIDIEILAQLLTGDRLARWTFTTLTPEPDPPASPIGFLPPNGDPPEGEGSVSFAVDVADGAPGPISNGASIQFDANPVIVTNVWVLNLDDTPPESAVIEPSADPTSTTFTVQWGGSDTGAGVGNYTVYVSENGGDYAPWLSQVPQTQDEFNQAQSGNTYSFYTVARDQVGNVEETPTTPDVTVTVQAGVPGDLDGDNDVDSDDYLVFRTTLGKCTGSPGFNPEADYDGDGCVTYADYRAWIGYYRAYLATLP